MFKNVAGQKILVYAYDADGAAKTGDAANITATLSIDGDSTPGALTDTNPDEIGLGVYSFNLEQAETNGDVLAFLPASATSGVTVEPVILYTQTVMRGTDSAALAATALTNATWTDAKAVYLDATISSRSTLTAQNVWEYATRTLSSFGTLVADMATAVWGAATRTLSAFGFTPSLDAAYDAAKTAATQTSVNDLPTNSELATALGTADDAVLAAIAALNNLSAADVRTAVGLASANLDTQIAALSTYVDTEVASILAAVDTEVAAIKAVTDKLNTTLALDGAVYRFTENALELGPSTSISAADIETIVDAIFARAAYAAGGAWNVDALQVIEQLYINAVGYEITISTGIALTSAIVNRLYYKKPSGAFGYWDLSLTDDATIVTYTTVAGDINEAGRYFIQPYVEIGTRKLFLQTLTLDVFDRFE